MIRIDLKKEVQELASDMEVKLSDQEVLKVLKNNPWEGTHDEYGESWWIDIEDSIYEMKKEVA